MNRCQQQPLDLERKAPLPARISTHRFPCGPSPQKWHRHQDRKSTRLNSSHVSISYAVFCLKKKKIHNNTESHRIEKDRQLTAIEALERREESTETTKRRHTT